MGGMTEDGTLIFDTPSEIEFFRLASLKYHVKCQKIGLRFKGGRISPRKIAVQEFGLKPRASYDEILAAIQKRMDMMLAARRNAN